MLSRKLTLENSPTVFYPLSRLIAANSIYHPVWDIFFNDHFIRSSATRDKSAGEINDIFFPLILLYGFNFLIENDHPRVVACAYNLRNEIFLRPPPTVHTLWVFFFFSGTSLTNIKKTRVYYTQKEKNVLPKSPLVTLVSSTEQKKKTHISIFTFIDIASHMIYYISSPVRVHKTVEWKLVPTSYPVLIPNLANKKHVYVHGLYAYRAHKNVKKKKKKNKVLPAVPIVSRFCHRFEENLPLRFYIFR